MVHGTVRGPGIVCHSGVLKKRIKIPVTYKVDRLVVLYFLYEWYCMRNTRIELVHKLIICIRN